MNQCLRSLSCLLSVAAVALFATGASARGSHQQQHAKKTTAANKKTTAAKPTEAKTAEAKKTQHRRAAAGKGRHGKQAAAQRKSKRSKEAPAEKEAAPPLTGDLALVKEAIDLARKAKTEDATAARNTIADPAGAEARRMVHPAPLRRRRRISAAMRRSSPPIRNGRARRCCAGAQKRGCGRRAATRRRFTPSPATGRPPPRASSRSRACCSPRAIATAPARLVREAWRSEELSERSEDRRLRGVPRPPHPRGPSRAHGQAHRRQGPRRRQARRAAPRRRRACDRQGLCRGQGQSEQGARTSSTTSRPRRARISATRCAASSGCSPRTRSTTRPA